MIKSVVCGITSAGRKGCTPTDGRSESEQCHLRSDEGVVGPHWFVLLDVERTKV